MEQDTDLLGHVLLAVAHEEDARETARVLKQYDPEQVTVAHVIEKGGGAPDKTPVSYSQEVADESYAAVREYFPEANRHTAYHTNISEGIFEAADAADASSIVFRAREANRFVRLLTGDIALKLVTKAPVPVIALPRGEPTEDD